MVSALVGDGALRGRGGGGGKEITLIFQKYVTRYVIVDAKKEDQLN